MTTAFRRAPIVALFLFLLGCAGYRGGWESLPYIGDAPATPPEYRTPFEAQKRSELSLPGLTLGIGIDNRLRTSDKQVYLYVLPVAVDSRHVQTQAVDPNKTRVTLRVSAREAGFVFRPQLAMLSVGGTTVSGRAGFEFGMWDESGNRVASGGQRAYRRVSDEYALTETDKTYLLSIEFPVTVPPPETPDITLDVSRAIRAPGLPSIPLIRFLPVRWREGYT